MATEILNPTVEQLNEMLNKIGWRVAGRYPNARIINHEDKPTAYRVLLSRIEMEDPNGSCSTQFSFKGSKLVLLKDGDSVAISPIEAPGCAFVIFMNLSLNSPKK